MQHENAAACEICLAKICHFAMIRDIHITFQILEMDCKVKCHPVSCSLYTAVVLCTMLLSHTPEVPTYTKEVALMLLVWLLKSCMFSLPFWGLSSLCLKLVDQKEIKRYQSSFYRLLWCNEHFKCKELKIFIVFFICKQFHVYVTPTG